MIMRILSECSKECKQIIKVLGFLDFRWETGACIDITSDSFNKAADSNLIIYLDLGRKQASWAVPNVYASDKSIQNLYSKCMKLGEAIRELESTYGKIEGLPRGYIDCNGTLWIPFIKMEDGRWCVYGSNGAQVMPVQDGWKSVPLTVDEFEQCASGLAFETKYSVGGLHVFKNDIGTVTDIKYLKPSEMELSGLEYPVRVTISFPEAEDRCFGTTEDALALDNNLKTCNTFR